jgi:hypothetical protein
MVRNKKKQIGYRDIIGDRGIALIHTIVGDMGCVWTATKLEAGIDGYIEIRDHVTGEMTNLIIQVQSKATEQDFQAETRTGFNYYCDQRDLDYWLSGNAPVILILSRPSKKEAYWVSIKDYFKDLTSRGSRKIHFDKTADRFDVNARDALFNLAKPKDSGVYLSPSRKSEKIFSNLLKVASFAEHIYVANTEFRWRGELWDIFEEMGADVGSEWALKDQRIMSFHDLEQYPWREICDQNSIDLLDSADWAYSDDPDCLREFVELLKHALEQKLFPDVLYTRSRDYYYFAPTAKLIPRKFNYRSLARNTQRVVFQSYPKPGKADEISYYRHSAFYGKFIRHDEQWFLEITPTYRYTWNGYNWSWKGENLLTGIKRKERNPAVLGQIVMWAEYLKRENDMFVEPYPFLRFDSLMSFDLNVGLPDKLWLPNEDSEEADTLPQNQSSLFDLTEG